MEARILDKAKELFFNYGIRSVTMDDIAKSIGASKKTIYQYFADKSAIVERVIGGVIEDHGRQVVATQQEASNAIEEVWAQTQHILAIMEAVKPGVLFDVRKYFPGTWNSLTGHKFNCVLEAIKRNLERGIAEGLYRDTLDVVKVSQIRLVQLDSILNQENYPAAVTEPGKWLHEVTELYLYGISTNKGQKIISQYLDR